MNIDGFTDMAVAAAWLTPSPGAPWHWDEGGEAIEWEDGTTILFREELARIVEQLSHIGLPESGAMILLLAACRGKVPAGHRVRPALRPVIDGLEIISTLPPDLIQGVQGRAALVGHLLDHAPSRPTVTLKTVIDLLRSGEAFSCPQEKEGRGSISDDAAPLLRSCARLDAGRLENLLRTGILEAPGAAPDLDFPTATQIGAFLDQILTDPDLAPIAKITRQIMAAVSLPEALTHMDDEALGGFSDLGNRGPLHRLLLSELAHDDDTLCLRIAMNEALYLRREPAADKPSSRLVVLLDSGLRMWGIPRLFATATALAFLAKCGKHRLPEVYRASGGKPVPCSLWTKPGLTQHLEALETGIHPGAALAELASAQNEQATAREFLVITHSATVASAEFQQVLHSLFRSNAGTLYLAGVDREGGISFSVTGAHGMKLLKEARIDPQGLLEKAAPRREVTLRNRSGALHAIFQARPFPFFLPLDSSVEEGWALEDGGGICVTQRGYVWRWFCKGQGAIQLPIMPLKGGTVGLFADESMQHWHCVKHRTNEKRLDIARWNIAAGMDPETGQMRLPLGNGDDTATDGTGAWAAQLGSIEHSSTPPLYAFARESFIYLVFKDRAVVVSAVNLRKVGEGAFPRSSRPVGTRFLQFEKVGRLIEYGLFYWDGFSLQVIRERMQDAAGDYIPVDPVLIFDRPGHESAWAVNTSGRIYSLADPLGDFMLRTGKVVEAVASPLGDRVRVKFADVTLLANLETKQFRTVLGKMGARWSLGGCAEPDRWSVRIKFSHVAVCPSGCIAIRSSKAGWLKIELKEKSFVFTHDPARTKTLAGPPEWGITEAKPFSDPHPENPAILREAEWAEGSRAFLDSRGMLHLQSRDTSIPEVTFVLTESLSMPAWSSDDRKIGPKYFIGEHVPAADDAAAIDSYVREFVGRIIS